MKTAFRNRVERNTFLPESAALMPVFEAIVNAIQAIEETRGSEGHIQIDIRRSGQQSLMKGILPSVKSFAVTDNGSGFTERNFQSFLELDSPAKADRGGKGIGRLLWLKAFRWADVESTYRAASGWRKRQFRFSLDGDGVTLHKDMALKGSVEPKTSVRLVDYQDRFAKQVPKKSTTIAHRIIEHCFPYFLLDAMPKVTLHDPDLPGELEQPSSLNLTEIYREEFAGRTVQKEVAVSGHKLLLQGVFLGKTGEGHRLQFCADKRVVTTISLEAHLAHVSGVEFASEGRGTFAAFVSGGLLDRTANQERTRFDLPRKGELDLRSDEVYFDDIIASCMKVCDEILDPYMKEAREASLRRIELFIVDRAPKYRPLLDHKQRDLANIPASISDEELELRLHGLFSIWRNEVRRRVSEAERELANTERKTWKKFGPDRIKGLFDELDELSKAELAEYVVHRKVALDFLESLLGRNEAGRYPKEDVVHDLFFPRRATSADVAQDDHNLWIIDERLAFHQFLASDTELRDRRNPIPLESTRRPDLLVYNRAAFSAHPRDIRSVSIVEFKRPERSDGTSPIDQLADYIRKIRAGKVERPDGSIVRVEEGVPFYCYLIASLTDRLRMDLEGRGFFKMPDQAGYFWFNGNLRAYFEVLPFEGVIRNAQIRNAAFFDKLQLSAAVSSRASTMTGT
jgi:hypothetical protein